MGTIDEFVALALLLTAILFEEALEDTVKIAQVLHEKWDRLLEHATQDKP